MKTLLLLALVIACKNDAITIIPPAPAASEVVKAPVDHLAPNELLEGSERAFGLVLPRGVRVDKPFNDIVYASGQVPLEGVKQYIRTRVRDGKMIEGDFSHQDVTTFDHVRVPINPDRELVIVVHPVLGTVGMTRLEIRDVTPVPAPKLPDDRARWAAAGLKPNGQVLDPTKLQ
jgi:hypothetical protein